MLTISPEKAKAQICPLTAVTMIFSSWIERPEGGASSGICAEIEPLLVSTTYKSWSSLLTRAAMSLAPLDARNDTFFAGTVDCVPNSYPNAGRLKIKSIKQIMR